MSHEPEIVEVVVTPSPDIVIGIGGSGPVSGSEASSFAYHHSQGAASTEWEIIHNLGFYPNVTVMDSAGSTIEGELEHYSRYRLRVTFSAPISGNAYLS